MADFLNGVSGGLRHAFGWPLANGGLEQEGGKAMLEARSTQINVLVIDNHPDVLNEIARILHRVGYECQRASSLDEAAACVAQVVPDLIVADVHLAGRGGLAFCDELRRRCDLDDVPVMFLSSMQQPDIIRRADTPGGTYYLRKPFDAPVFVELVERTRRTPRPHLAAVL